MNARKTELVALPEVVRGEYAVWDGSKLIAGGLSESEAVRVLDGDRVCEGCGELYDPEDPSSYAHQKARC